MTNTEFDKISHTEYTCVTWSQKEKTTTASKLLTPIPFLAKFSKGKQNFDLNTISFSFPPFSLSPSPLHQKKKKKKVGRGSSSGFGEGGS